MNKTVLLTGFEPFNNESVNPAWEAVSELAGWREDDFAVVVRQLPCVFGLAGTVLREALDELKPDLVIAVGQAGGRVDISVERIAINVDDAPIPDNARHQPVDEAIVAGGPAAYFSTLPIKAIVAALRAQGLPASVSQSAGTFVCNDVFYRLMHAADRMPMRAGFIHIPYLPQQAACHPGAPSMALAEVVRALRTAVKVSLRTDADVRATGGMLS
ncbi:pyroglutamyl-peptidase I [Massilia sp. P8910]|uniref:pyroglutamyl-peptidase I n=1 Tax=Massilia antarctica TaxID=2765360 RepID=UPI001E49CCEE|nr:pyroglutamyl-peptidase I [Massilia antarctica]MCE3607410.1 pyroglutamyl-peptidase I [Massilia antarctica]